MKKRCGVKKNTAGKEVSRKEEVRKKYQYGGNARAEKRKSGCRGEGRRGSKGSNGEKRDRKITKDRVKQTEGGRKH